MYILYTLCAYLLCAHFVHIFVKMIQFMYIYCTSVLCTCMYMTVNVHMLHILYIECNIPISVHIMSFFWVMTFSILDKNDFQYHSGYIPMCVHFVILSIIS